MSTHCHRNIDASAVVLHIHRQLANTGRLCKACAGLDRILIPFFNISLFFSHLRTSRCNVKTFVLLSATRYNNNEGCVYTYLVEYETLPCILGYEHDVANLTPQIYLNLFESFGLIAIMFRGNSAFPNLKCFGTKYLIEIANFDMNAVLNRIHNQRQ